MANAPKPLIQLWHYLLLATGCALFWWICSGYTKPFFIISGILSVVLTLALARRMRITDEEAIPTATLHILGYWPWLILQMALSSLRVMRLTLAQSPAISPRLAWIPARQPSAAQLTTYANSITLTPGTVSVRLQDEPPAILVHALESASIDDLEKGDMDRRARAILAGGRQC